MIAMREKITNTRKKIDREANISSDYPICFDSNIILLKNQWANIQFEKRRFL